MKKLISQNKPIIFIALILVFVAVVAIIAFSGKTTTDTIEGTYKLVDASGAGSEMFKATVGDAKLVIGSDKTGALSMFDQETPVVVDVKDKKISFDGGKSYSQYKLENNKLTIENSGYKAVFKK